MTSDSLISIDAAYSSALPDVSLCSPETAPFWFEPDKPLKLRVFIDSFRLRRDNVWETCRA